MNKPPDMTDIADLHIPTTPVGKSSSSFRDTKLVISEDGRRAFIRPTFGSRIFGLFFIAFGGAFVGVSNYIRIHESLLFSLPFGIIGGLIALVGILGGLGFLSYHCTIDRRDGRIRLGRLRQQTILLADCRAIQICLNPNTRSSYISCEMNLVFESGWRVTLMCHGNTRAVSDDAKILSEFLRLPMVNHVQPAGEISKSPMLCQGSGNFRTRAVKIEGPDRAIIGPSAQAKALYGVLLAMGILAPLLVGPLTISSVPWRWPEMLFDGIPFVLGIGFTLAGLGGIRWSERTAFDRKRGDFRQFKGKRQVGKPVPLADIEALQVCSYVNPGDSDTQPYAVWELNLVLKNFERINLMSHGNRMQLFFDAQKLAGFLARPLLDHSDPEHADQKKVRNWRKNHR